MLPRGKKLSEAHVVGKESEHHSETAKRRHILKHCPSLGGALEIDCELSEPCTAHMLQFGQVNGRQRNGRIINASYHRVTVGRVRGRSNVIDGTST